MQRSFEVVTDTFDLATELGPVSELEELEFVATLLDGVDDGAEVDFQVADLLVRVITADDHEELLDFHEVLWSCETRSVLRNTTAVDTATPE